MEFNEPLEATETTRRPLLPNCTNILNWSLIRCISVPNKISWTQYNTEAIFYQRTVYREIASEICNFNVDEKNDHPKSCKLSQIFEGECGKTTFILQIPHLHLELKCDHYLDKLQGEGKTFKKNTLQLDHPDHISKWPESHCVL